MDRSSAPSRTRCPRCATALPETPPAVCPACALAIGSDAGRRLLDVEAQLVALRDERAALIAILAADERVRAGASAPAPPPSTRRRGFTSRLAVWLSVSDRSRCWPPAACC